MRKFQVIIETPFAGGIIVEYFEIEDDASEKDIEDEAREIFLNNCNYGFHEVDINDEEAV
ncbi:hypothetical protein Y71_17210 [Kosakonia radicincitans DSM 16656]|uniref:DUF7167 family protein n=1 Tax=Kosakonia radicincitans TaxID=283686 RepID=UPI000272DF2E|nr:hypothetical protein [Kosakonia radicincitans]ARD61579.1 hypothetical protein Y71_17210 [Kosakonia radicincitans DSM 16656]